MLPNMVPARTADPRFAAAFAARGGSALEPTFRAAALATALIALALVGALVGGVVVVVLPIIGLLLIGLITPGCGPPS